MIFPTDTIHAQFMPDLKLRCGTEKWQIDGFRIFFRVRFKVFITGFVVQNAATGMHFVFDMFVALHNMAQGL